MPLPSVEEICQQFNIAPHTVVEVGPNHPNNYRLDSFVRKGVNTILVEANPRLAYCLYYGWNDGDFIGQITPKGGRPPQPPHQYPGLGRFPNVKVYNCAVVDKQGPIKIFERNASSYVEGIKSPAIVNDNYVQNDEDAYTVNGITIDQIDNGKIDILLSDTEGSEWFSLKYLISRPKLIVLELTGQKYVNPYIEEILTWINKNNYTLYANDATDYAFIHKSLLK